MSLIADIVQIYRNYPAFKTEVLVASVRSPLHVVEAGKLGAHVATLPPAVLRSLFNHPLTDKGLAASWPTGRRPASTSPDTGRMALPLLQPGELRRPRSSRPSCAPIPPGWPTTRPLPLARPAGARAWRAVGRPHGGDGARRAGACRGDGGARRQRAGRRPRRRRAGRAGAGGGAGAAALADPADCVGHEMPGILGVDAVHLCLEALQPGTRPLPQGTVARLLEGRQVLFREVATDARLLHAEAAGLAEHDALALVPGEGPPALLALLARDRGRWTPDRGRARWPSSAARSPRRSGGRMGCGMEEASGALPPNPHQGALPLGTPPRAEPLEPFTWLGGREGDLRRGCLSDPWPERQPRRRSPSRPPNQTDGLQRLCLCWGVQGGKAPMAGSRGRAPGASSVRHDSPCRPGR